MTDSKQKLYVAGPMKDVEDQNFPEFKRVADHLRSNGFDVVSPHELNEKAGFDGKDGQPPPEKIRELLTRDAEELLKCDGVAILHGWDKSHGASGEVFFANAAGIPVRPCMRWPYGPDLPKVLGLTGPKGVGKTTLSRDLADARTGMTSFASPIRQMLLAIFPPALFGELKNQEIPDLGVTGREMLQTLGTEWGRKMVCSDVWVKFAKAQVARLDNNEEEETEGELDSLIYDDLRFPNEAEMIKEAGGEVWRLSRRGYEAPDDSHVSEDGIPDDLVDREIELNPED